MSEDRQPLIAKWLHYDGKAYPVESSNLISVGRIRFKPEGEPPLVLTFNGLKEGKQYGDKTYYSNHMVYIKWEEAPLLAKILGFDINKITVEEKKKSAKSGKPSHADDNDVPF